MQKKTGNLKERAMLWGQILSNNADTISVVNKTIGCSLNIVFFLRDFSELCQFCCSAGVLSAWCVYTH